MPTDAGSAIRFTTAVLADHPALPGHFPGHPIVPGVVLLNEVLRAARATMLPGASFANMVEVKFNAPVAPGDSLTIVLARDRGERLRFSIERSGVSIASGRFTIAEDKPA